MIGLPFLVPDLPDTYCRVLYGLPSTADSSQGEAGCCDVCRRTPCSLVRTPDQTQQPRLLFVRALSLEKQPWDLSLGPIVYYTTVLVVLLFCSRRYLCWSLCFDFFSQVRIAAKGCWTIGTCKVEVTLTVIPTNEYVRRGRCERLNVGFVRGDRGKYVLGWKFAGLDAVVQLLVCRVFCWCVAFFWRSGHVKG